MQNSLTLSVNKCTGNNITLGMRFPLQVQSEDFSLVLHIDRRVLFGHGQILPYLIV